MAQYKQKKKEGMLATVGLYSYPVLMAADILLYNAQLIPVGEDQTLHMDLARQLSDRMNTLCGKKTFNRPEVFEAPYVTEYRVMDLQDGTKKMSKSNRGTKGTLFLDDKEETVKAKILGAKTDSEAKIYFDEKRRPEVSNLMKIYAAVHGLPIKEVDDKMKGISMDQFKADLCSKLLELYYST